MRETGEKRKQRAPERLAGIFIAGQRDMPDIGNMLPGMGSSTVRIGQILVDDNYKWVLEEVEGRDDELYDKFIRELNAKYCIKLMSDDMLVSSITLLGKPLLRAEEIPVKRLAAILVLLSSREKGKYLAILLTNDGEVRAYRESGKEVSAIALVGKRKQSLGDCLFEIRKLSGLKGKAIIYKSLV